MAEINGKLIEEYLGRSVREMIPKTEQKPEGNPCVALRKNRDDILYE